MKHILKYLFIFFALFLLVGCKKFLNVRVDNNTINPRTVTDFEEMLNGSTIAEPNFLLADFVSDDIQLSDLVLSNGSEGSYFVKAYLWDDAVWAATEDDYMYNETYKRILQMNIILDNIMQADSGSAERKEIVAAQAKINRAYCYYQLVNLYGADYQNTNAAKELAVPLVLHPDASELPHRNTVQEVYDQVLVDLNDAVSTGSLPDFGVDVIHPGKAAAQALLARTYLNMDDYDKALASAELVLKIKNTLLDYRRFDFVTSDNPQGGISNKPFTLRDQQSNPEILLARVCIDLPFYNKFLETFYISRDVEELYGTKDLRFVYNFKPRRDTIPPSYLYYSNDERQSMQFNYSIGVPEMMLIKAECLARKGEGTAAIQLLDQLRQYRFADVDYSKLEGSSTDALTLVLKERQRELYMRGGMRLFDLKRLNNEPKYKRDLERKSLKDSLITTLEAGSPRYLIPFAPKNIANNPLIIQNER
ncbi:MULTISPECIES: RagB/SusD family nutrient uptake outer membrane protein [unclassified Sphingobacterium]|uniref:RagB/SusD family nutrient uptake outer membrane protein n=1 Tax=unclassified Sphingobacterium TaxID=2609468 RepID=UPI001051E733|nr:MULTISPECIES: RagB/SusD family nutrient uptake outer membrane protein [unclassified Sphingobacterium]MCS3556146.1 tetratricopeptide (TPR) repeat protein [Sphingobacterium sp. JUb21]TCR08522.1 SusD-like starch-binding protein associating with outer membrane [Sphingobacterium sp. JUb20]